MKRINEIFACFLVGAALYPVIEILWRGYSHFSMAVVGGVCFSFIYLIHTCLPHIPLLVRSFFCCAFITSLEFVAGIFLNMILRLDVWDYSCVPFNLFGQICLFYCAVWYALSLFCAPLCYFLQRILRKVKVI